MTSPIDQSTVTIINALTNQAYENGQKVHIMYIVGDENGHPFPEQQTPDIDHWFPLTQTEDGKGTGPWATTINISPSACKQFTFQLGTGDYVYDVSMGGKPFFGNITLQRVLSIVIDGIPVWSNQFADVGQLSDQQKADKVDPSIEVGQPIVSKKEPFVPASPEPKKASWADNAVVIQGGKA